jgi:hypothetical protein
VLDKEPHVAYFKNKRSLISLACETQRTAYISHAPVLTLTRFGNTRRAPIGEINTFPNALIVSLRRRTMRRALLGIMVLSTFVWTLSASATAGVPHMIFYQGHLTDAGGTPLDTAINMTFTIYDDSTGGTVWWTETQMGVVVSNGLFNVLLGSVNAIIDTLFAGNSRWLGIQIASDPEIVPRTRLVTVPYAYRVATVDGATGGHVFGSIQLHSDLVVGGLIQGEPGGLYVTNGDAPFLQVEGSTEQVGIGMIDPNAQFHVETQDYYYSGSFTGLDPSDSVRVVQAEYLGEDAYDAVAVYGRSAPVDGYGYGGYFQGGYMGVSGRVAATGDGAYSGVFGRASGGAGWNMGVQASASGPSTNVGVQAHASNGGENWGVWGHAEGGGGGATNYGIYGSADGTGSVYAGYFDGNVGVTDTFYAGMKLFKIDHPLDPENRYLVHACVESADMMNVYNGNVILDAQGEAAVELPNYFEALNGDFRYQLTCIGGFAPVFVAQEVVENQFTIAGGEPGMKVSWQVTGIRRDPFAAANGMQVEVDKPAKERGKYLHPRACGLGEEYGVHYEQQRKMRESLAKAKGKGLRE